MAAVASSIREFFLGLGFEEVLTPILSAAPNLDSHVEAFFVEPGKGRRRLYLRASPEHFHKRLLCRGRKRIFEIARVFRDERAGGLHCPEFTLLEWYRTGEPYGRLMEDIEKLLRLLARRFAGAERISYQGTEIELSAPFERLSIREAMGRFAGIDPFCFDSDEEFARAAARAGFNVGSEGWEWEDTFFMLMVSAVEPSLPKDRPVFLYDYPERVCVYARPNPEFPQAAERFELYVAGIELGNGFGEVSDAGLQRSRFERELRRRRCRGEPIAPLDEDFLREMEAGMPECCGAAMGLERLAMLLNDARSISEVAQFGLPVECDQP